jgi:rhodanese-related sulfurtransferase
MERRHPRAGMSAASSLRGLRPSRLLLIVAVGVLPGFAWNTWSGRGFPLSANALVREGDQVVDVQAAKQRLDKGALFLDARPQAFYEMGHVPGALPLPEDDFDRGFAQHESVLRQRFDIIVYCSGYGCEASHIVARKLKEKGVQAEVLQDGWPAWEEARYPTRSGSQP